MKNSSNAIPVSAAKYNKASGFDAIPVEVLKMILRYLFCIFCLMFVLEQERYRLTGERVLLTPFLSLAPMTQGIDPLSHRGITLHVQIILFYT